MTKKNNSDADSILSSNKKAFHDYEIGDRFEAGLELCGTEVKSCRDRAISLIDAYVKIENGEAKLYNAHIAPYGSGNRFNHEAKRTRKLLLHKSEILKLSQKTKEKGFALIPLKFYLKRGLVKVEIGLGKGKTHGDKRDTLRRKQDEMDTRREIRRA